MSLKVNVGKVELKNPFMPGSGTFGCGLEYKDFGDISALGAIVTKGVSLKPRKGNNPPRICEIRGGMINSIGLENAGFEEFKKTLRGKELGGVKTKVVVNFFGNTFHEYISLAEKLSSEKRVDALEMNISCPNIKEGGICFGTDTQMVFGLTSEVRKVVKKPLWVKLTPNTGDITGIAGAAEKAGADALVVANTYTGMAVDIGTRRPMLNNIYGGCSGPAVKPLTLYNVYRCVNAVKIPVIGCGGILTLEDALEYFIVGANAVQVGTANFTNPAVLWELIEGLKLYLSENKLNLRELIGSLKK